MPQLYPWHQSMLARGNAEPMHRRSPAADGRTRDDRRSVTDVNNPNSVRHASDVVASVARAARRPCVTSDTGAGGGFLALLGSVDGLTVVGAALAGVVVPPWSGLECRRHTSDESGTHVVCKYAPGKSYARLIRTLSVSIDLS